MLERRHFPFLHPIRTLSFALVASTSLFALLPSLSRSASAGEPQDPAIAEPVARDDAPGRGLHFRGKRLGRTQGESPVFDYDGDGDLDILLSTHGSMPWLLMRNRGDGTFSEVLAGTFPRRDRHGCIVGDFGSIGGSGRPDGRPDLYCVIGACRGLCTRGYPNELYLQGPDGNFVNVARSWGVEDRHGRAREAIAVDYDKDGLLDLVVANEAPSMLPSPNRLFKNLGGRFEDAADPVVGRETASECVDEADIDGDGWTDLLFCSTADPQAGVLTYKNASGSFQDVTPDTEYRTTPARDLELEDVNRDGKPDLLVVERTELTVRLNRSGGFPRVDFDYPLDEGHGVAVGDVNLDGAPDIYIVQGKNELYDDIMLLGAGGGASYRSIPIPQAREGEGDVATAIPNWDRSGRTAFLVTNGRWSAAGPVQLIAFSAATLAEQRSLAPDPNAPVPPEWALRGFVAGLGDPTPGVFEQLGAIGQRLGFWAALAPRAEEIAPRIVARLGDPAAGVRLTASAALEALRARDRASVTAEPLGGGDAEVRQLAGPFRGTLDANEEVRAAAGMPGDEARVAGLVAKLTDADAGLRRATIDQLRVLGAKGQVPAVAARLGDPDAGVRRAAVAALTDLGAKEQAAVLAARLADADAVVRRAAIGALMQLGAKEHAPAVVARLGDPNADVGRAAIVALGAFGAKEQVQAIAARLGDADAQARQAALGALMALGAKGQAPAIAARLGDPDPEMRRAAVDALRAFKAKEEAPAIAARLSDPKMGVRMAALAALRTLGAKDQVAAIAEMLADPVLAVRRRAVMALGVLGANQHSRAIARMLGDGDAGVREAALETLLRLEPHSVQPALAAVAQNAREPGQRPEIRAAAHVLGGGK
jgi:HEAT repeat protein